MTVITRTKLIGACGGVALAAALLPGAASGTGGGTITGAGVLRLHLGSDGSFFKFQPPTGSPDPVVTQTINAKKCVVTLNPAAALVTLTPTPARPAGAVGLTDDGLGVKAGSDGTGTPCGRVDGPSQALTLTLAGSLAAEAIDLAELDIEGKFDVTVLATATLRGTPVGTVQLPTAAGSDSGPDSGDGDNFRWVIDFSLPFDQLVLSVDPSTPGGAFSLGGGRDGTTPAPGGVGDSLDTAGTADSVFQLTDITVIDCGETADPVGGEGSPEATFSRGPNPNCTPLPYLLRTDPDNSVLLQKDASSQPGANFFLDIVWDPEPTPTGSLPLTTIDYDGPGGNEPQDVQWCGGTASAPDLPDGQNWCLTRQTAEQTDLPGQVQVSEKYYGAGDPRWAR